MFMKIKNLIKFIVMSPIQYVIDLVEFSRAYKQVNKFLGQYKDRAIMIRVTPAQAQLLINCAKLGILNSDDLNKAIGPKRSS